MRDLIAPLAIAACATAFLAAPAFALTRTITMQAHGSGVCQGALPNFEGKLRKRPLGIQNEGTESAYVTCSPTNFQNAPNAFGFSVGVANYNATSITITCTGVHGQVSSAAATFVTKSVTIASNFNDFIDFPAAIFNNANAPSVSCLLPPGTSVDTVYSYQTLDVGG